VLDELRGGVLGGVLADPADRAGTADLGGAAGGVPLGTADLVQRMVGELDDVERVGADPNVRGTGAARARVTRASAPCRSAVQVHRRGSQLRGQLRGALGTKAS
jgi:hypothetical protein